MSQMLTIAIINQPAASCLDNSSLFFTACCLIKKVLLPENLARTLSQIQISFISVWTLRDGVDISGVILGMPLYKCDQYIAVYFLN